MFIKRVLIVKFIYSMYPLIVNREVEDKKFTCGYHQSSYLNNVTMRVINNVLLDVYINNNNNLNDIFCYSGLFAALFSRFLCRTSKKLFYRI